MQGICEFSFFLFKHLVNIIYLCMRLKGAGYRRLWGKVNALEPLLPYANPRSTPYLGNVYELLLLRFMSF